MKTKYLIGFVLILLISGTALVVYFRSISAGTDTPISEKQQNRDRSKTVYTLDDVSLHASASDCWMAIEGKVYDVTTYVEERLHPGGAEILLGCGTDATEIYNTRPMGSNTPHSEEAREDLDQYYIGELKQ